MTITPITFLLDLDTWHYEHNGISNLCVVTMDVTIIGSLLKLIHLCQCTSLFSLIPVSKINLYVPVSNSTLNTPSVVHLDYYSVQKPLIFTPFLK